MKSKKPANVYCPKCDSWLAERCAVKVEDGYLCNECFEEEQEIKEFEKVGEENFGSKGKLYN